MSLHASEAVIFRECIRSIIVATALLLAVTAGADDTLYARLGSAAGVHELVHRLIEVSSTDSVTRRSFARFNRPRLEKLLEQQICQLAGGGCRYQGDNMQQSHAGLDITEAEFYGMVEHLRHICDQRGLDQRTKNDLLALLAPMKQDIVTR